MHNKGWDAVVSTTGPLIWLYVRIVWGALQNTMLGFIPTDCDVIGVECDLRIWILKLPNTSGLPWWISPFQAEDWKAIKQYTKEEKLKTSTLNSSDITNIAPKTWPVAHNINNTGHGYSFSVSETTWAAHQTADRKGPKNITFRATGSYTQIWDGFMWLTPRYGHFSIWHP